MGKQTNAVPMSQEDLFGRIISLEQRVSTLEAGLAGSKPVMAGNSKDDQADETVEIGFSGSNIESSFGEFGLAWIGNLVLLFGIVFLVKYMQNKGLEVFSTIIGYAAVAGLFLVSNYLKNSHKNLASIFSLNGYVLLFIVTMQLHFFTNNPLLPGLFPVLALLLVVTIIQSYIAIRRKSEGLAGLAFVMAAVTAILSNQTHFLLPITVIVSITAVIFLRRFGWWRLLIFSIFLVYIVNLLWLTGNPFMNHAIKVLKDHESGYFYLFIIAAAYSSVAMIRQKGLFPDNSAISSIIINGLGFSFLVSLYVLAFFKDNYILLFGSIALFCLVYSIFLKSRSEWKVTAALYALYSFVALSVTVYGIYTFPRAYFLLALQSVLVVSMALWFRSRVIVVMNTFLFLILLIVYLATAHSSNSANIAFALVSLITARTLNLLQERLRIKTELLRNTYLITGFFMVLYALYRLVPGNYVTLSWTAAAALYFLLSFAMRNIKYRYLALATMAAAAIYLFIADLARVEIVYRVMAFLFLAMISIALSLYYTKRRKKRMEEQEAGSGF
jgi:hypothetical protein